MRSALALALTILVTQAVPAQETVSLKWTFKEGTTFYANSITDMDMKMSFMGQDIDLKMKMTAVQRFKVTAATPKATTIEMTMLTMKMEAEGIPGGIPGLGDLGDRVKGATITATLDEKQAVTKVTGYDKFLEKLAGDDENLKKVMKQQFSEAAIGQMVSQVFSFGPDKPVKVGDSWNRTDKMPAAGFEAVVKQKYTLTGVTNDVAKIGLAMDMAFKAGDSLPGLPEGVKLEKFDMKADKFTGTLLFDTKAGRLTENKQEGTMDGSMTLGLGGQKVDMTMKIKLKQVTTVTDKNPVKD
jgi:hypothetical protein